MTAILVMEAENIFEPEKMQVELPVCEPENSGCLDYCGKVALSISSSKNLSVVALVQYVFLLNGVEYFVVKKSFRQGIVKKEKNVT